MTTLFDRLFTPVKTEIVKLEDPIVRTIHNVIADIEATDALIKDLTSKQADNNAAIAAAKASLVALATEFANQKAAVEAKLNG